MSQSLAPLWAAYMQGNRGFAVVHTLLLLWALVIFARAMRMTRREQAFLAGSPVPCRLAALASKLRDTGGARRLDVRDLYETRASVDTDDLGRIANLLLLIGVAGTLWSLFGGARAVQIHPATAGASGAADALRPVLASFNAFSVTIVSVGLALVVLVLQRAVGRAIATVAYAASQEWQEPATAHDATAEELRDAVRELVTAARALGPQGDADWARTQVEGVVAELTANARAASAHMINTSTAFAAAFSDAVAPVAARVTAALAPMVERLDGISAALQSSTRSLEVQRELLHQQATALQAIDEQLGTAETAVRALHDIPAVVGTTLLDAGKHVSGALESLHGNFETKIEQILKLHEGAVLTVATRMRDGEAELATAVSRAKDEVTQYLTHYGKSLSATVDGMLASATRTSDAAVWTPVRSAVEEISAIAQRTTQSVTAVERTAVAVVESVQRSLANVGERARAITVQLDRMQEAKASTSRWQDSGAGIAHWVSTGVLTVAMLVLCTLYYARMGR